MRLPTLAVGAAAALALALSVAAPVLADDATPSPVSDTNATPAATSDPNATTPPADPTAPVESAAPGTDAASPVATDPATPVTTDVATPVATDAASPVATDVATDAATPTASPTATPQIGGNGAYSYPFVLTTGTDGSSVVTIEVAGTGVSIGYTVDAQGKVTDALVAAGDATLVKVTPHTIKLVLASGERVTIKVHGDSVRVKVKPRKGGPLRPGIATATEVEADEAAEVEPSEAPETETEDADEDSDKGEKGEKGKEKSEKAKSKRSEKSKGHGKKN